MKVGDEVLYALHVPNVAGAVAHDTAQRLLKQHGIPETYQVYDPNAGRISVARLLTRWKGDAEERDWQRAIRDALPGTIIDVQPWTPAPGYPISTLPEEALL